MRFLLIWNWYLFAELVRILDTAFLDLGSRTGAVNKAGKLDSNAADAVRHSLGSAVFPDEQSEEGIFHQEVMYAVQRWFSAHGWPGGAYPIKIPDTLRRWEQL